MMRKVVNSVLAGLLLAACGGGGGDDDGTMPPDTATDHFYVSDKVYVPQTPAQATDYGVDLDGDPQKRPDNQLGNILSTLAQQDVNIQMQIDEAVAEGDIILLHRVKADFSKGGGAEWQVYLGAETMNPDFTGQGMFSIDAQSPRDAILRGLIVGGEFQSPNPGTIPLSIALVDGADPLKINLVGARIIGDVADGSCDAKMGGAITKQELDTVIMPAIADMMNTAIQNDAGCQMNPPMCGSSAQTILDLFDPNNDMMITVMEIQENSLIKSLLAPDVDLFDSSGKFNPRQDGVEDSLSLGIKVHCVGAVFTP